MKVRITNNNKEKNYTRWCDFNIESKDGYYLSIDRRNVNDAFKIGNFVLALYDDRILEVYKICDLKAASDSLCLKYTPDTTLEIIT